MSAPSESPPGQPQWSAEARSVASLLIFIHLFAVVVAVTTYTRPSQLQRQLHELFAPYLRNLHLTAYPVSYPFARYYMTHALPGDVDFACQVEFQASSGETQTISIPPEGLQPLVRYRRYQLLANATGALADPEANDDASGILPKAIAGSILKRHGAERGTVLCRAHFLPDLEMMSQVDAGRRGPLENYGNVYEAQVFLSDGNVELLKKSATLEVAPVEGQRQRSGVPSRPSRPRP